MLDDPQPLFATRTRSLVTALAVALAYALIIYIWTRWLAPASSMLLVAFLIGAPVAACVLAVRLNDPKGVKPEGHMSASQPLL